MITPSTPQTSSPAAAYAELPLYRNTDYLLVAAAGTISATGSKLSQFALPFLALELARAPLWAALLSAAQLLPYLFFSLPAGAWVDRANRKRLLVACDLLRAGLLVTIPLAYMGGALTMPHLFVVIFAAGLCTLLFEIAELATLPQLVATSRLARARAISEGIDASTAVAGKSLGGLIVGLGRTTLGGAVLAYLVDSASYLASALTLLAVRRPLQAPQPQQPIALAAATLEGLRFLWGQPTLRLLMLLTAGVNFVQAPLSLYSILITQDRLGLAPAAIGAIFGVAGGGAVVGSLIAAWWYRPARLRGILLGALAVWALAAALMAIAPSAWLLTLGLALTNVMWPIYAVAVVAYRLAITPEQLQGRVASSFRMVSYGAEPLGLAAGGLALTYASPAAALLVVALALLGCAAAALRSAAAV